eukprot:scaffold103034_cov67-Phaeocystis_antarctica.AAC.4
MQLRLPRDDAHRKGAAHHGLPPHAHVQEQLAHPLRHQPDHRTAIVMHLDGAVPRAAGRHFAVHVRRRRGDHVALVVPRHHPEASLLRRAHHRAVDGRAREESRVRGAHRARHHAHPAPRRGHWLAEHRDHQPIVPGGAQLRVHGAAPILAAAVEAHWHRHTTASHPPALGDRAAAHASAVGKFATAATSSAAATTTATTAAVADATSKATDPTAAATAAAAVAAAHAAGETARTCALRWRACALRFPTAPCGRCVDARLPRPAQVRVFDRLGPRLVHSTQVVATVVVPRTALGWRRRTSTVAKVARRGEAVRRGEAGRAAAAAAAAAEARCGASSSSTRAKAPQSWCSGLAAMRLRPQSRSSSCATHSCPATRLVGSDGCCTPDCAATGSSCDRWTM